MEFLKRERVHVRLSFNSKVLHVLVLLEEGFLVTLRKFIVPILMESVTNMGNNNIYCTSLGTTVLVTLQ